MTTDCLLSYCKFYNGTDEIPKSKVEDPVFRFFWNGERIWYEHTKYDDDFSVALDNYIKSGLTHFAETDDTPVTLKAFLFIYFMHVNEHVRPEDFKDLYTKRYFIQQNV